MGVAWSPDNKKIAYCLSEASGSKLYVLDISASKSTAIPSPGRVCVSEAWVWYEPYKILFVEKGYYNILNLETLQTEQIFRSHFDTEPFRPLRPTERAALKQKETEHNARQSALEHQVRRQNHPKAYIHPGYLNDGLMISALDGTYQKLLLKGLVYGFDVSPNLDSIVYRAESKLLYAKLGAGKPRPTRFVIALDKRGQLSESQQQVFEKYWRGMRVRSDDNNVDREFTKPSFWGDVYAPQVNPLTGKVVGPDHSKPKGRVIFESSADTHSIVRSYFETAPIAVGDIVTRIRSDMVGGHGFSAGEMWLPLKSAEGVLAEANTTETKQESSIESNKEVASPETQRGSTGNVASELSRFLSLPIASRDEFKKFGEAELHRAEQAEGPSNRNRVLNLRKQATDAARSSNWQRVVDLYNQILSVDAEDWNALFMLCISYNELHQPDQTLAYAAKALKQIQYNVLYAIVGVAYGQKGDKENFLTWLEKAVDGGSPINPWAGSLLTPKALDKSFPQYRDDPRYKAIMQKYRSG